VLVLIFPIAFVVEFLRNRGRAAAAAFVGRTIGALGNLVMKVARVGAVFAGDAFQPARDRADALRTRGAELLEIHLARPRLV
jgi:hypothetical protein